MKLEWLEWSRVERLVNGITETVHYLTMWERDGSRERLLARLHLDDASVRAFLDTCDPELLQPSPLAQNEVAESRPAARRESWRHRRRSTLIEGAQPGVSKHGAIHDAREPRGVERQAGLSLDLRRRALVGWVRSWALRIVREDVELIGFRVRAHAAGSKSLASACFSVCNLTWIPADDDVPLHRRSNRSSDAAAPAGRGPVPPGASMISGDPPVAPGAAEAYEALGQYYAQTGQLWVDGYQSVLTLQVSIIQDTLERLQRSRDLEDRLRAELVQIQLDELRRALAQSRGAEDPMLREAMLLQAMSAVQEFARNAQASRFEAERLSEVRALLDAAPGLMVLLQDPVLQPLLRDPGQAPLLAQVLRAVVAQLTGHCEGSS